MVCLPGCEAISCRQGTDAGRVCSAFKPCIKDKKEQILCLWEEGCLQEVTSARSAGSLTLRDSLPLYLDHLCEALATNRRMDLRSVAIHNEESTRISKLHGADRATNRSYTLSEVIFEYHILREVLFHVLEADGPLAQGPRDIVLNSIEQAVNDAVVKFTEMHADIQQTFGACRLALSDVPSNRIMSSDSSIS